MRSRRLLSFIAIMSLTALSWAVPAGAATLPAVPIPPNSDAWISLGADGQLLGPFVIPETAEPSLVNMGVQTTSANGTAVELTEGLNGPASDYIYAVAGFLYFSSDDENGNFSIHPLIPNGVA